MKKIRENHHQRKPHDMRTGQSCLDSQPCPTLSVLEKLKIRSAHDLQIKNLLNSVVTLTFLKMPKAHLRWGWGPWGAGRGSEEGSWLGPWVFLLGELCWRTPGSSWISWNVMKNDWPLCQCCFFFLGRESLAFIRCAKWVHACPYQMRKRSWWTFVDAHWSGASGLNYWGLT